MSEQFRNWWRGCRSRRVECEDQPQDQPLQPNRRVGPQPVGPRRLRVTADGASESRRPQVSLWSVVTVITPPRGEGQTEDEHRTQKTCKQCYSLGEDSGNSDSINSSSNSNDNNYRGNLLCSSIGVVAAASRWRVKGRELRAFKVSSIKYYDSLLGTLDQEGKESLKKEHCDAKRNKRVKG